MGGETLFFIGASWELKKNEFEKAFGPFFKKIHANSKKEALKNLTQKQPQPDLIFIDYQLTDDYGIGMINEIRQHLKNHVPIILIIDPEMEMEACQALHEGVFDYITQAELYPAILKNLTHRALEHSRWAKMAHLFNAKTPQLDGFLSPDHHLFQRDYFFARLKEETKRAERYNYPLSLVLFWLHEIEMLEDENQKNQILIQTLKAIKTNTRTSDLLAQLGPFQFSLLLPHTDTANTQTTWQRTSEKIQNHLLKKLPKQKIPTPAIHISLPFKKENLTDFLREASQPFEKEKTILTLKKKWPIEIL